MSDGIVYNGRSLGSIHFDVYGKGQLPGEEDNVYIKINDISDLEDLLGLKESDILNVGNESMNFRWFKEKYLGNVRDIHIQKIPPNRSILKGMRCAIYFRGDK